MPFTESYDGDLTAHPVSRDVNNVRNNNESLIEPIEDEPMREQATLI